MTSLCLYLAVTPVTTIAFEHIEHAHSMLSSASLTATLRSSGLAQDVSSKYEVKYRWPSELRLRTLHPATGRLLRDRVVEPTRIVDYDPELEQYTVAKRNGGDSLGKIIATLEKDLDDLLLAFMAPEGFKVWLVDMVKLSGWKLTGDEKKFTLTYKKGAQKIVLEANKPTSFVRRIDVTTGTQRLVGEVSYAPSVSGLAFRAPAGVYEVSVFDREMRPVTYANAEARKATLKMFEAYSGLNSFGFKVKRDTGETKVQILGDFIRQDDSVASWTYDGSRLTFCDKRTNKWFTGKLSFSDVVDSVGSLGTRVDPTARLLYSRFNPYRKRLGDGSSVKVVGTMPFEGESVTILECESENALVTLFVREDGLVAGSSARAKNPTGDADETVDLRYSYFAVPRDLATKQRLNVPIDKKATVLKPASAS